MWDAFAQARRLATMRATTLENARLDEEFERQQEATRHLQSFSSTGNVGTLLGQKFLPKVEGITANGRKNGKFVPRSIAMIARALGNTGFLEDMNRAAAE